MRRLLSLIALLSCAALPLLLGSCARAGWPEGGPKEAKATEFERRLLFAPVALGGFSSDLPGEDASIADALASKIQITTENVRAWYSSVLPGSDQPQWDQGPLASARGADLIVLTQVTDAKRIKTAGSNDDTMVAKVLMRGINAEGKEVWRVEHSYTTTAKDEPKKFGKNTPAGQAVMGAANKCATALKFYLDNMALMRQIPASQRPPPDESAVIEVVINSTPQNADVLFDGTFIGTTPMTAKLPARPLTMRIVRQGYQAWEYKLEPKTGMTIQPALERIVPEGSSLPAPTPIAPAATPAPKAEEAPDVGVPTVDKSKPSEVIKTAPAPEPKPAEPAPAKPAEPAPAKPAEPAPAKPAEPAPAPATK